MKPADAILRYLGRRPSATLKEIKRDVPRFVTETGGSDRVQAVLDCVRRLHRRGEIQSVKRGIYFLGHDRLHAEQEGRADG